MTTPQSTAVDIIDSHTGGEPTRVVMRGGPALAATTPADAARELRERHDDFRRAVLAEPRGGEELVGALLLPPTQADCVAGVVFFNNVGYLGMCGHGTIGVAVTLLQEGRISTGVHRLETPVGEVSVEIHDEHRVTVRNVASWRRQRAAEVEVPGIGTVSGDIAWGGNWFFLVENHGLLIEPRNVPALLDYSARLRRALDGSDLRGDDGACIDHVELFGPPSDASLADSRNFVLCPGAAWDRSPCGTGTSAKLACLLADGRVGPGDTWRQQGICGSVFEARADVDDDGSLRPAITGDAWLTARATLLFDESDPFARGLPANA